MHLYYKSHIIAEASRKFCCRLHLCLGSSICESWLLVKSIALSIEWKPSQKIL